MDLIFISEIYSAIYQCINKINRKFIALLLNQIP